jgi:hypothetical protein
LRNPGWTKSARSTSRGTRLVQARPAVRSPGVFALRSLLAERWSNLRDDTIRRSCQRKSAERPAASPDPLLGGLGRRCREGTHIGATPATIVPHCLPAKQVRRRTTPRMWFGAHCLETRTGRTSAKALRRFQVPARRPPGARVRPAGHGDDGTVKPGRFRTVGDENYVHVIMPMFVTW